HTRSKRDWSSDVCSSDLKIFPAVLSYLSSVKEVGSMKTCMYLRKSRAEDLSDSTGDTLRRHRETLEETARAMQLTICGVYEEVRSEERRVGKECGWWGAA